MAENEAALKHELSSVNQFRANPIPFTSIIPKYHEIISVMGNKATEICMKAISDQKTKLEDYITCSSLR